MPDAGAVTATPATLVAFLGYMAGVFLLGFLSHKLLARGSFLKEYFLGNRQLNAWVLGLTYVATSVSAGSLMGFPSLIYRNGWIMAFFIGGYMVAGLVGKGVLAKRLNQVSRLSGAITVPDVLRDRFQSPALGMVASVLLLIFLTFNLVAQFKAGGLIMREACSGVADTAPYQQARHVTSQALAATGIWTEDSAEPVGKFFGPRYPDYVLGMVLFALTVIAYTTYGGFWAVTWTDVLQGIVIMVGAVLLMFLALHKVGGLAQATAKLSAQPELLTGPGPDAYLPIGLAISYFCLWTLGMMGQPVGMVRLMACRDTQTLRRALFMVGIYYALIYVPLLITFICARALYPTEYMGQTDRIMPVMALQLTRDWPILGGLILAAPYAAAMSAVAGFLLLMSSSLVRDIYQRNFNANVSARTVQRASYLTTAVVGAIVTVAALWPPEYLQYVVIFTSAGMTCTFLAPMVLGLYWRRATRAGALAAMGSGFLTVAGFWLLGMAGVGKESLKGPAAQTFAPLLLLNLDPLIYGLIASFACGILVSFWTQPLPASHVDYYFVEPTSVTTAEVPVISANR